MSEFQQPDESRPEFRVLSAQGVRRYEAADEPTKTWLRTVGLDIPDTHYQNLVGQIVRLGDVQQDRSEVEEQRDEPADLRLLLGRQRWPP
ncbi:MAG TPA: hypothetical protein VHT27_03330 [Solirubrobacteraceae bacterium]|nr:hypothetical protein [Solirubrobacteraceae bacterium]